MGIKELSGGDKTKLQTTDALSLDRWGVYRVVHFDMLIEGERRSGAGVVLFQPSQCKEGALSLA